ncbi:hypothetical protein ATCC90586_003516 [Pythium insidiosum]|nr:hypothetical protein ATCC90586_003516 [Pythium insidiosum]
MMEPGAESAGNLNYLIRIGRKLSAGAGGAVPNAFSDVSNEATDYSMLVGYDVRKQEVVASIIDYIHKYDFLKMVEHAGKRLIQDEGEITVLNPRQYRKRFCIAMTKYFVTIPSRYTKVTKLARNVAKDSTLGEDDSTSATNGD